MGRARIQLCGKVRRVAGLDKYRTALPADAWVDIEAAAEVLRVYERLRRHRRDDLGVAPSVQSQELHRRLLR